MDKEEYETLKINCPKCSKFKFYKTGYNKIAILDKNKNINIVQLTKDGINYICLNCIKGDDALPGFKRKKSEEENL